MLATLRAMRYASIVDRVTGLGGEMWAIHGRARRRQEAGHDVILLTLGEPDFATPPAVIEAATHALRSGRTRYAEGRGEPEMLQAIAAKYSTRTGRPIRAEQVTFLPGTQTALCLSMMILAEAGDEVLVPEPYYLTYRGVVGAAGASLVPVPLSADAGFHLDPDAVAAAVTPRSRVLLLNSPHNPTGATLTRSEIEAISAVATDHDLWIISDEVYEGLVYGAEFASPFDLADMEERTVVVSSLSKSHAMTGWRCGWAVGSVEFGVSLLPLAEAMLFGSQPFLQDAATVALTQPFAEVERMHRVYESRARAVVSALDGVSGLRTRMPEGGIFLMVDVRPSGLSGEEVAEGLLREMGVAVMPGESFGPAARGHIRIGLVADEPVLTEACARIRAFMQGLGTG